MSAEVKAIDHGLTKLWETLAELKTLSLTVGFQGEAGAAIHPTGKVPVATIAMFGEFGTIDAPARSFMRTAIFEGRSKIVAAYAKECGAAVSGKRTPVEALSRVGHEVAELMRDKIDRSPAWAAENAASTIEKKGHSHPLIGGDVAKGVSGGTMRDAIGWAVRRRGSIVAEGT